ncbi:ATP-dependent helicase [Clostridiisalibacter paucivorans]|uniref:ATP-dependent helicase n=1 Tax=Clostridiisalibacter paucivorans TaxID=408753 RepID=UPI0006871A46|nr:ATP-dependent helicase [Clostridiisalibacter paucivorans]
MKNNLFDIVRKNQNIRFNTTQESAINHVSGPALVLAVPGSGKTTLLVCRTANLIINKGVSPNNILSLTFSKASERDMKKRFNGLFGDTINTKFSTIHSFSYGVINQYCRIKKIKYTLLESKKASMNKYNILRQIYERTNSSTINEDKLEELINTIGYVKNMMYNIGDFREFNDFGIKNFSIIFKKYEEYKKINNYIDFDDMLTMTYYILKSNANILNTYQSRYKYIQLDEGQDTSKIQYEIIKLLSKSHNNIFIVADDDQSIYGFRGAYPEILLNFKEQFKSGRIFFMEENYRSSKNIVSVSHKFIQNNKIRYEKKLFTKNKIHKPIEIMKFKDEFQQLEQLIKKLKSLSNYSDTAILYRNNISSIALSKALLENNIPFSVTDNKFNFFNHWILKDISAFIKLSLDNTDIVSLEKIYYKMNGYIPKSAINFIKNSNESRSVFDKLLLYPDFKSFQLKNIKRINKEFKILSKLSPLKGLEHILSSLNYNDYLKDNCKAFGHSYDNIKSILSALKIIAFYSLGLIDFLNEIPRLRYDMANTVKKHDSNKLRMSTIHSSKGLEFKRVFIIDLIENEFPSSTSISQHLNGNGELLEEERRLFYVGMTRAKEELYLLTIQSKNNEPVKQSTFISELEDIDSYNMPEHDIVEGDNIAHIKFGQGTIKKLKGDTASICFEGKGIKNISMSMAIKKNILKKI